MFIGHYGIGLLAKKNKQLPSLAIMFIAVQLLDLIWPILVLLGIESLSIDPGNTKLTHLNFEFYPYSHSLFMALMWSIIFGLCYLLFTKNKKGSLILGALVMSHWILDFITHRPDLPIAPFSDLKVGLGLWNYPVLETILELSLFGIGAFLYFKSPNFKRKIAFWLLVLFLLIVHMMNLLSPPPPSVVAVAWSANLMWLIVIWAWWIEKKPSSN
ncbi:metal-dependent hydrolase [Eudoraea chungangensis]|uniref:metal-dependent hydrolase n=1 Tax=Eudoraea chungangensis TaxID=1481905 RepID=UPI0023EBC7E6|nr:metal-dependent hydrolase [Eudoraea chungangensis]